MHVSTTLVPCTFAAPRRGRGDGAHHAYHALDGTERARFDRLFFLSVVTDDAVVDDLEDHVAFELVEEFLGGSTG